MSSSEWDEKHPDQQLFRPGGKKGAHVLAVKDASSDTGFKIIFYLMKEVKIPSRPFLRKTSIENEQKYKIKPDIIIYSKERNDKVILDTKWKTLLDDSGKPDVSNSDIYQMYVYQKKTSARKVVLLFPMVEKLKEIHYTNADDIDISPYQTDMNNVENAVKSMKLF